ncbi:unnamed protein product [Owenia fusiformis]|uniref:Uncharacterized protein n=1 Tax=Owenia fusiformis TaxID=6347 RepID=A0A8J1U4V3_OWEFU|nr:unnamed protein product [Owenia fusiformis]
MEVDTDNTQVMRIKNDFAAFLSDTMPYEGSRFDNKSQLRGSKLSFEGSIMEPTESISNVPSVSVKSVLADKEKDDRIHKAALLATKGKITKLESQMNNMASANKRARVEYEKDVITLKNEHKREISKFDDLKLQLKFMTNKEAEARSSLMEMQSNMEQKLQESNSKISQIHKEKVQWETKYQDLQETIQDKTSSMKKELMRQQTEMNILNNELEETTERLNRQTRKVSDLQKSLESFENLQLESSKDKIRIKELEGQLSKLDNDSTITRALKSDLTKLPQLDAEARKLREENTYLRGIQENTMLLKERLDDAERKIGRFEERSSDIPNLQLKNEQLLKELDQWKSINTGGPSNKPRTPIELSKRLASLQSNEASLLEQKGTLQATCHSLENSLKASQQMALKANQQLTQEVNKSQQATDLIKRLQRKLLLITKERDGYKNIIDQYESEVTVNVQSASSQGSNSRVQQLEETNQRLTRQTEYLEKEVEQAQSKLAIYMQRCTELDTKLVQAQQTVATETLSKPVTEADQKTILSLREQVAELEKQLEKVSEEKYQLESRIEQRNLQGDYDPTKTKVLHFSMNPAAIAQKNRAEELERLRDENEKLRARVKILEEADGKAANITMQVDEKMAEPNSSKELEEMKSQVNTMELKNKRLREAFMKTSHDWRELVYEVTGFKVDAIGPNQYKVQSMYAEAPDDFFVFQVADGHTTLLANDYSASLTEFAEEYLEKYNSIPGFICRVTLDLLSKQTIMQ